MDLIGVYQVAFEMLELSSFVSLGGCILKDSQEVRCPDLNPSTYTHAASGQFDALLIA